MKIMICASMTFAKQIDEAKKKLEEIGHIAYIPHDTHLFIFEFFRKPTTLVVG